MNKSPDRETRALARHSSGSLVPDPGAGLGGHRQGDDPVGGGSLGADPPGGDPPARGPVELYLVRLSAPCRVVWLYLLQHDIPHILIDVDFSNETNAPDVIQKLHHKEVPILVDGDITVFEAPAILRYLAQQYTHFAGFGITMATRMTVESLLSWGVSELHRITGYSYAYPSFLDRYRLPKEEANEVLIEQGIRNLCKHLERLENGYLKSKRYLAGDRITVADSLVATVLLQAEWVGFKFKLWPRVDAWLRRLRAEEYWATVHAAHMQLIEEMENATFD